MAILMPSASQTDLDHIWELSEPSSSSESENSSVVSPPHKRPRPLTARDLENDSFGKIEHEPIQTVDQSLPQCQYSPSNELTTSDSLPTDESSSLFTPDYPSTTDLWNTDSSQQESMSTDTNPSITSYINELETSLFEDIEEDIAIRPP